MVEKNNPSYLAKIRIDQIKELITRYEYHYYVLGKSLVSDPQFDLLFHELLDLEAKNPELSTFNSPSQRVGSDLSQQFKEEEHYSPMLSLDKVYSLDDIDQWIKKLSLSSEELLSIEPKIDGFSVALTYKNGNFNIALSRGNGLIGNDISENVKTIKTLPLFIKSDLTYVLRGEIFILKKDFLTIQQKSDVEYANPRNFAAGTIRRIHSQKVRAIPLKIFIYEAICLERPFVNHQEMIKFLIKNHFPVNNISYFISLHKERDSLFTIEKPKKDKVYFDLSTNYATSLPPLYTQEDIMEITDFYRLQRNEIPYEIDGLVFKVNSYKLRDQLGTTNHHPKWAMALKFESPKATARVENIITQVGRTGKITPLAFITPTHLNGSMISKATLHNQDYIDMLELNIGDIVEISKRGEIIPSIERVLDKTSTTTYKVPLNCPSCNSDLQIKGAHYFCFNISCKEKIKGRLLYFTKTLDMDGFGPSIINFLYEQFQITTFAKLISFDYRNLLTHEGYRQNKVNHFVKMIQKTLEKTSFRLLLIALGIPELNEKLTSILWNQGYDNLISLKNLSLELENQTRDISHWHQLGEKGIITIKEAFSLQSVYIKELEDLEKLGFTLSRKELETHLVLPTSHQLQGTIWLITGTFLKLHPRKNAIDLLRSHGATVVDSFSTKVTHLLKGKDAGSKLKKAEEKGVKIILEDELFNMVM